MTKKRTTSEQEGDKTDPNERRVPSEDIDMGKMPGSDTATQAGHASGLQPGGTKPGGGHHQMGSVGTSGGSTGPRSDKDGTRRRPEDK